MEEETIMNETTSWYEDEMSIDFWFEGKRWGSHKTPRTFCVAYAGDIFKFPTKAQAVGELAKLRMLHPEAPIKQTQWVRRM